MNSKNDKSTDFLKQIWPAANEDSMRYNVPNEVMHLYEDEDLGDCKFVYCVREDMVDLIKEIGYELGVKEDIQEAVDEYLKSINYSGVNEFGETVYEFDNDNYSAPDFLYAGESMNYYEPLDRTVIHDLRHESIYTIDFVRVIQNFLKKEFPLWRLHIFPERNNGEEGLMIYPEVVRVGKKQCPPDDLEVEIEAWQKKIFDIREKERGPRRRQLEYLKPRLTKAASQLTEQLQQENPKPFVVIAAFDNWEGCFNDSCFWMLQNGSKHNLDVSFPEDVGTGDRFYTTLKGKFLFKENDSPNTVYHLYQEVFSSKNDAEQYEFEVSGRKITNGDIEPDGRKWTFHIEARDIIADAELRKMTGE